MVTPPQDDRAPLRDSGVGAPLHTAPRTILLTGGSPASGLRSSLWAAVPMGGRLSLPPPSLLRGSANLGGMLPTADLARARALLELRRYDEALDLLATSSLAAADAGQAHCLRAQALIGTGRAREAGAAARAGCALLPHDEWPHRLLAISEQSRGHHRRALEAAREAARLAPFSVHAQHTLALTQVNVGDAVGAELTAARCVEQAPRTPLAHQTVAAVALVTGKLQVAEAAARRVLQLTPQDDGAQALLAIVLERQGRQREAAQLRTAAVRANPQSREHRRQLARRAVGPAITVGWLGKFAVVPAVVQVGRFARHGSSLGTAAHPLVLVVLHAVAIGMWGVSAWRRRQAGRDLPAGFYDGLRPERRMSDTTWLLAVGGLACILAAADLLGWAWGDLSGRAVVADAAVGIAEVSAAIAWRRRLCRRHDLRPRRWRPPDIVALLAGRLAGGRRASTAGRAPLEGLRPAGEARAGERLTLALRPLLIVWLLPALVMTVSTWGGIAVLAVTAAAVELRDSRRPGRLADGGYRVVVTAGTSSPPDPVRLAGRGVLRILLLPVVLLELVVFQRRPHRCLHDRACGTTVARFRTSLDRTEWAP